MRLFRSCASARGLLASPAVTIGNFDGVHLGHQSLIKRTIELARARQGAAVVFTFDPHPSHYFRPETGTPLLQTEEQKLEHLARLGVDAVVIEPFNAILANQSAQAFVTDYLVAALGSHDVVVGSNFTFGRQRGGNISTLGQMSQQYGFVVHEMNHVTVDNTIVSSTQIRTLLASGEVVKAGQLLGRDYEVVGSVVTGHGRGSKIGVPTANVAPQNDLLPRPGVYAVWVSRAAAPQHLLPGVANIGYAPTFGDNKKLTFEVHLLDFKENILGQSLRVRFAQRLREEERFESITQLVNQIQTDISTARKLLINP